MSDSDAEQMSHGDAIAEIAAGAIERVRLAPDSQLARTEQRLLGMDKARFDQVREDMDKRREAVLTEIGEYEKGAREDISFIPDEARRAAAGERLTKHIENQWVLFRDEQVAHLRTMDMARELALEAFYDTNTPLFARQAFVRVMSHAQYQEMMRAAEDPSYEPLTMVSEICDGMLFHAANTMRGTIGFDRAIREEAKAQIAVAKVFAKEYSPYQPFASAEEALEDKNLQDYVLNIPANRALFERLSELASKEGNYFEEFQVRVNAGGGDEFLRTYIARGEDKDEMIAVARELSIGITKSAVIVPEYDVIDREGTRRITHDERYRRMSLREHYGNSVNGLKVGFRAPYSGFINDFYDVYRAHIQSSSSVNLERKFLDPSHDLTMDMAIYSMENGRLPSIDDAPSIFISGRDKDNNVLVDGRGSRLRSFFNENGTPDKEALSNYSENIADRLAAQSRPEQLMDDEYVVQTTIRIINEDIMNRYVEVLNDWVNEYGKPSKKKELVRVAYGPNPDISAAMNIAATAMTGRDFVKMTDAEKTKVFIQIYTEYEATAKPPAQLESVHLMQSLGRVHKKYPDFSIDKLQQTMGEPVDRRETSR